MNEIQLSNVPVQTMSSLEIAKLTGKEHRNVMRDIRIMLTELHGVEGVLRFEQSLTNPQNGQVYPVFNLPKRESLILVSGYSIKMRAAIIDRWQELESKNQHYIPKTYSAALQLCADQAKELEEARPAIEFAERHASAKGLHSIRETAKALHFVESEFVNAMLRDKVIYRTADGKLMPYAEYQKDGTFDCIAGSRNGHAFVQTKVTAKGMQKLSNKYSKTLRYCEFDLF